MNYTDRQVEMLMKKIKLTVIPPKKRGKEVMKLAARPLVKAEKTIIRTFTETKNKVYDKKWGPGWRYRTRANGTRVYSWRGNLMRATRVFNFKSSDGIHVGPKVDKKKGGGPYSGRNVDAWYAHFLAFGTTGNKGNGKGIAATMYHERARKNSERQVKKILKDGWLAIIRKNKKRYGL